MSFLTSTPVQWVKRARTFVSALRRGADAGLGGVLAAIAALCGYVAGLNTGAGATTCDSLAVVFDALSLGMIGLSVRPKRAPPGPSLEVQAFDPPLDGVVKPPEFGWGPAAWMRLRVRNRSGDVGASDVRLVLQRVVAHGHDTPAGNEASARSRNNHANLHLKVADYDGHTIASLAPGEERHFDLAKLNAAFSSHPQYWGLVVDPPHKDIREELFVGIGYDAYFHVAAANHKTVSYVARLACTGWPCSPSWPCESAEVWKAFTVTLDITPSGYTKGGA